MKIKIWKKSDQAFGSFNNNEIIENKPIGFPQDGGSLKPFSKIFYWAHAKANADSTIGLHPHTGFEILSFVLKGEIVHFDTKLNKWNKLRTGDVQVIQAGSGISHAEKLEKNSEMFQIWFDPNFNEALKLDAKYKDYSSDIFPVNETENCRIVDYSRELDLLTTDLKIQKIKMKNTVYKLKTGFDRILGLYILSGNIKIGKKEIRVSDFIQISDTDIIEVESEKSSSLFIIEGPIKPEYKIYGSF